jgi:hypothetical protein
MATWIRATRTTSGYYEGDVAAWQADIEARLATLEALVAERIKAEPVPQCTATANQTYSWLPGDVWSQYCAAVEGKT